MSNVKLLSSLTIVLISSCSCLDLTGKKVKGGDEKIQLEPEKIRGQQQEITPIIDKNSLGNSIDRQSAALFEKESMIKQQLKPEEIVGWNMMMAEIRKYVEYRASEYMPIYNKLEEISNDLLNTLALNYTTNVSSKESLNKGEIERFFRSNLSEASKDVQKIKNKLEKRSYLGLPYKRNAKIVLLQLAETIEAVLKKVFDDLKPL